MKRITDGSHLKRMNKNIVDNGNDGWDNNTHLFQTNNIIIVVSFYIG